MKRAAYLFLLACTVFPTNTLARRECEYREREGVQHPEVRPNVDVPPIQQSCEAARAAAHWSDMPCRDQETSQEPQEPTAADQPKSTE